MFNKIFIFKIFIIILSVYLSSCSPYFSPVKTTPARLGPKTQVYKELKSLPLPKDKIVAAVYKFRDQTGQYKETEGSSSWSTAVTQGATSILINALEESGWFIPIEREGLSNLLNERKIIRSSRANYEGEEGDKLSGLPPLLYAGILLEGGVVSYESNIITGGSGLKYFGAGGSNQYRQDQVTIYLRATSTSNGRILKTVYTTKTILSQMVDIGLFRYVEFKRLLEAEAGFSYNEPPQLAVTAAIEKAVQSLVLEGILDSLWATKYPTDTSSETIKRYLTEKDEMLDNDYLGNSIVENRDKPGIGILAGGQYYYGELPNPMLSPGGEIYAKFPFSKSFFLSPSVGFNRLMSQKFFDAKMISFDLQGFYHLTTDSKLSPFVFAGASAMYRFQNHKFSNNSYDFDQKLLFALKAGVGFEYMLYKSLGFNVLYNYYYMLNDQLDEQVLGKYNDYFMGFKAGFTFYF